MRKQEITITEFELQDCNGNLGSLKTDWTQVPTVPTTTLSESKGQSAEAVRDSLAATKQVSDSFQNLLENSYSFFTQMGIAFQESDEKAAQNINSVANC